MIVGRWDAARRSAAAPPFASTVGISQLIHCATRGSARGHRPCCRRRLRRPALRRDDHHPGRRRRTEHPTGRRRAAVRARGRDLTREERDRAAAYLDLEEGADPSGLARGCRHRTRPPGDPPGPRCSAPPRTPGWPSFGASVEVLDDLIQKLIGHRARRSVRLAREQLHGPAVDRPHERLADDLRAPRRATRCQRYPGRNGTALMTTSRSTRSGLRIAQSSPTTPQSCTTSRTRSVRVCSRKRSMKRAYPASVKSRSPRLPLRPKPGQVGRQAARALEERDPVVAARRDAVEVEHGAAPVPSSARYASRPAARRAARCAPRSGPSTAGTVPAARRGSGQRRLLRCPRLGAASAGAC